MAEQVWMLFFPRRLFTFKQCLIGPCIFFKTLFYTADGEGFPEAAQGVP